MILGTLNTIWAAVGILAAWMIFQFETHLTLRAILRPTGIYTHPYATHGGVVYISGEEMRLILLGWIVTFALVAGQLGFNYLNSARKRH